MLLNYSQTMSIRVLSASEALAKRNAVFASLKTNSFFTAQTVENGTQLYLVVDRINDTSVQVIQLSAVQNVASLVASTSLPCLLESQVYTLGDECLNLMNFI
jgi:uncharacterized protein with ACT and thioredoxin-like domain